MSIYVIAEHDNQALKPITAHVVSAARALGEAINVIVMGSGCRAVAEACAQLDGVTQILLADDDMYHYQQPEALTPLLKAVVSDASYVLAPASTFGKALLPRLAALLDVAQISDIIGIESGDTFIRPIYAGNALATVQTSDAIKLLTIRATAFDAVGTQASAAPIATIDSVPVNSKVKFIAQVLSDSSRPELGAADIVVSGGRALGSAENFALIEQLADVLGAAVGASRAAVDAGFVPNDYQVGQTGKVVAPNLYIAIGISGAVQHLAGMKDSKVIVAINKDPDAPIFEIADYGLVGDLFTLVPELIEQLKG